MAAIALGALMLTASCAKRQLATFTLSCSSARMDSTALSDRGLDSIVALYRDSIQIKVSERLGASDSTYHSHRPESPLTRFIADALFKAGTRFADTAHLPRPDMAITNIGGIRASVNAGPITVGDIYQIAPFENTLVLIPVSGKQLSIALDHIAKRRGEAISGALLHIHNRQITQAYIGGQPLDTARTYTIATIDYIAEGGDGFGILHTVEHVNSNILVRDILIDEVRSYSGPITMPTDKRIYIE